MSDYFSRDLLMPILERLPAKSLFRFRHPNVVVLWVPFIQIFLTLSEPSLPDSISVSGLHCYAHGLGYSRPKDDYKVVRLVYLMSEDDTSVILSCQDEVYSLRTRRWKRINGPMIWASQTLSPAYVNGVIHWTCLGALLLFDVSDKVFCKMKLPNGLTLRAIAACNGSLLAFDYEYELRICGPWVMKEYGVVESWMRHTVIFYPDWMIRGPVPLSFSNNRELLASTRAGELLFCDRRPLEKKKLGDLYVDKCFESLYI
ncbi:F-box protein CPR1-like [Corylus avellana]|uniref:F-box protein CPR1-like n=1 Tax=Corylus avellana TaxID=13451 RepID=UPI00286CF6DA|nr:F-box protein CPR1-like [Corylus avellana]